MDLLVSDNALFHIIDFLHPADAVRFLGTCTQLFETTYDRLPWGSSDPILHRALAYSCWLMSPNKKNENNAPLRREVRTQTKEEIGFIADGNHKREKTNSKIPVQPQTGAKTKRPLWDPGQQSVVTTRSLLLALCSYRKKRTHFIRNLIHCTRKQEYSPRDLVTDIASCCCYTRLVLSMFFDRNQQPLYTGDDRENDNKNQRETLCNWSHYGGVFERKLPSIPKNLVGPVFPFTTERIDTIEFFPSRSFLCDGLRVPDTLDAVSVPLLNDRVGYPFISIKEQQQARQQKEQPGSIGRVKWYRINVYHVRCADQHADTYRSLSFELYLLLRDATITKQSPELVQEYVSELDRDVKSLLGLRWPIADTFPAMVKGMRTSSHIVPRGSNITLGFIPDAIDLALCRLCELWSFESGAWCRSIARTNDPCYPAHDCECDPVTHEERDDYDRPLTIVQSPIAPEQIAVRVSSLAIGFLLKKYPHLACP